MNVKEPVSTFVEDMIRDLSLTQYVNGVIEEVKERNKGDEEFHQAVEEVLKSLEPVLAKHPEYIEERILERLVEPERQIMFRVPWIYKLIEDIEYNLIAL